MLDYDGFFEHRDLFYKPGRIVSAGTYQRVDVLTGRTIVLDREDWLPASLDGSIALYRRISPAVAAGDANGRVNDSRLDPLAVSR